MRNPGLHGIRRLSRLAILVVLDSALVASSLHMALLLRMNGDVPSVMWTGANHSAPFFVLMALGALHYRGIYQRVWRSANLADFIAMAEAITVAIIASVLFLHLFGRDDWLPTSVPIIQWFILIVLLTGTRLARRSLVAKERPVESLGNRTERECPQRLALLIGSAERVDAVLRQMEASPRTRYRPVCILDSTGLHVRLRLRNVPVMGDLTAFETVVDKLSAKNLRPEAVIIATGSEGITPSATAKITTTAATLGLKVIRATKAAALGAGSGTVDFEPINPDDLLGRPPAVIDNAAISFALKDRKVLITGAGGSIGRELVRQIALNSPRKLTLVDCNEYNLYSVDMEMQENFPHIPREVLLCSIRQRNILQRIFEEQKPEFVFHAAALKHVPLVECNVCSGILTNVLGTRNVADAAKQCGARAFVQVSTDKAVNPVGMMGATKRIGELYAQALDLAGAADPRSPRFMTVRFGNVLGSSGSLIPLFERQLSNGGPLTVTHPEINRFFMTIHEAVQLILQGTARALAGEVRRGRILVLDMGEPIKIIDIARRMIRLAGMEPDSDIKIEIVGLRPGEKLYEELFDESEQRLPSDVPGVLEAEPNPIPLDRLTHAFDQLAAAAHAGDTARARMLVDRLIRPVPATAPLKPLLPAPVPAPVPAAELPAALTTIPAALNGTTATA